MNDKKNLFINKNSYKMDSLVVAIVTIIVLLLLFLLLLSLGVVVFVMIVKITGRKNLTQWTVWLLLFLLLLYCYYCYHLFQYWVPLCLSLLWKWQCHLPIPQTFYKVAVFLPNKLSGLNKFLTVNTAHLHWQKCTIS